MLVVRKPAGIGPHRTRSAARDSAVTARGSHEETAAAAPPAAAGAVSRGDRLNRA